MANIDIVHTPVGNLLFYNLDSAVGKSCTNKRTDVLLVQYLLKEGCKSPGMAKIEIGAGFKPEYMIVNGVWDDYWGGYLANYLRTVARRGKGIVEDRRVDPVVAGHARGPVHHMQYTILYLNLGFLSLRPNDYPRLSEVADCPAELRDSIKVKFVRGQG